MLAWLSRLSDPSAYPSNARAIPVGTAANRLSSWGSRSESATGATVPRASAPPAQRGKRAGAERCDARQHAADQIQHWADSFVWRRQGSLARPRLLGRKAVMTRDIMSLQLPVGFRLADRGSCSPALRAWRCSWGAWRWSGEGVPHRAHERRPSLRSSASVVADRSKPAELRLGCWTRQRMTCSATAR